MLSSVANSLNPWLLLLSSAVVIWLFVWGGIKMWHKYAAKSLEGKFEEKFKPFFEGINKRLDDQDAVLENVNHEVTLNSGKSLKDEVKLVGKTLATVVDVLTTKPATPLAPHPTPGLVDSVAEQGRTVEKISIAVDRLTRRSESSLMADTATAADAVLATASKAASDRTEAAAAVAADLIVAAALAKLNLVPDKKPRASRARPKADT